MKSFLLVVFLMLPGVSLANSFVNGHFHSDNKPLLMHTRVDSNNFRFEHYKKMGRGSLLPKALIKISKMNLFSNKQQVSRISAKHYSGNL